MTAKRNRPKPTVEDGMVALRDHDWADLCHALDPVRHGIPLALTAQALEHVPGGEEQIHLALARFVDLPLVDADALLEAAALPEVVIT